MTRQTQLVGNAAANPVRMHIRGQLRLRLRLSKPHRLSHLQRCSRCLDPLQPGNPINPYRIRHPGLPWAAALGNTISQAGQHLIEPTSLRIDNQLRSRYGNYSDCHTSNATDQH
jgi:hypothetical protein